MWIHNSQGGNVLPFFGKGPQRIVRVTKELKIRARCGDSGLYIPSIQGLKKEDGRKFKVILDHIVSSSQPVL